MQDTASLPLMDQRTERQVEAIQSLSSLLQLCTRLFSTPDTFTSQSPIRLAAPRHCLRNAIGVMLLITSF